MGEESEEDSKFEIHTVKLPRTIHRTPSPEKKILDPCNNIERLRKLLFLSYILYFWYQKLKADRIKKMVTIFKFHWSYYLKDNSRFNKF